MVFFIDEARSRPPPLRLLTNVNKKMVFFIEGFPYVHLGWLRWLVGAEVF